MVTQLDPTTFSAPASGPRTSTPRFALFPPARPDLRHQLLLITISGSRLHPHASFCSLLSPLSHRSWLGSEPPFQPPSLPPFFSLLFLPLLLFTSPSSGWKLRSTSPSGRSSAPSAPPPSSSSLSPSNSQSSVPSSSSTPPPRSSSTSSARPTVSPSAPPLRLNPTSSPSSSFSVVSLNCGAGGLRARLFEISRASSHLLTTANVICLQECHLSSTVAWNDSKALQDALRVSSAPPFRALLGRDTGIIVRDPTLQLSRYGFGDRWTFALLTSTDPVFAHSPHLAVWSIHGPFDPAAWTPICDAIRRFSTPANTPIIIAADWNSVPDPLLDSLTGTPTRIPWCFPAAAIAPSETVDLFRLLRPDDVSWTYARTVTRADGTSHTSARRLDSIWGSPALLPLVYSTTVLSTSSDHRAVGVSFLLTGCNTDPSQSSPPLESHLYASRRPWSLHPGLWDNPNFLPALEAFARCYNPPVDPSILSPSTSWNLFHISLLAFLQPLARSIGQEQLAARHDLVTAQRDLDQLNIREPDAARRLPSLLLRWRSALGATQSSENLRPGGHTTAAALRAGSWLFSTFASAASRSFPPLRVTGGFARTSSAKLAALSDFYSSLFSARPAPSLPDSSLLLRSIQLRLDEPATRALNTPFSLEEVFHALRSANRHSSAGPDGITYRVYLATFSAAGPRLQDLANFLGSSPIWPVSARTILLPKAGDPSDIANYRPITITNACVRVISRLVSSRLLRFGSQLLPWTQAAFLPGRRSALVAGVIHGLSDLLLLPPSPLTPPAFFIISLDQRKAYDRVLRTWLFAVLRTVNFPPLLLGVLKALYSQPSTRISALGSMGPVIDLLCGVLQGDPSSCFLYNLSLQPLFDLLLTLGIGVDIPHLGLLSALAFADDCLLFVEASSRGLTQLATLFSCLGSYSAAAGAALNLGKSSFWLLGTPSATNRPFADQISSALSAYGLAHAGSAGPSSHLGHPLPSADASSPHPHTLLFSRLSSIKVRGACFRTMGVDVLSRVTNTNKYLGARLWHTIAVGPLPYSFASLYFDAVNSYIQGASSVLLSQSFLTRPISHGGLNLIDPDAMASALSVSFLRRYLLEPDQIGGWLRAGLTTYLAYRHGVPPAVLLIRTGKAFGRLRHWSTRNDGFLGRLTHALAHVDLGIHESWVSLPAQALLTLPWLWLLPKPSSPQPPLVSKVKSQKLIADGWLTWGDILWQAAVPMGWRAQFQSHPLGPPAGRSVTLNSLRSPFSQKRYPAGPAITELWNSLWAATPPSVRSCLSLWGSSASATFVPLLDRSAPSSHGWVPARQDPHASAFPWHLLTVYGCSLPAASTASVRRSLQKRRGPKQPKWDTFSFTSPAVATLFWTKFWLEHARLPLSPLIRATSTLVLNRIAWSFHEKLADASISRRCPRGCDSDDGMSHGYFACPAAQEVWCACSPILILLGIAPPLAFSPATLLPASGVPAAFRPRFALWRSCVLRVLYVCRHDAGIRGREAGAPPVFAFTASTDPLSSAASILAELLTAAWLRVLRLPDTTRPAAVAAFGKRWASGGSFVQLTDTRIDFTAVSDELMFPPSIH